jgi:hypothetical protein
MQRMIDGPNQIGDHVSNLKENADAFADCRSTSEDEALGVNDEQPGEARRASEEKIRKCLVCKSPFPSSWSGERVCRRCKSTSAWRSGALG